jgi:hypothetical protein
MRTRHLVAGLCLVVGLQSSGWAVVAGVPEDQRPGTLPTAWLGWSNDSFGGELGRNTDDYRTNAFYGGVRIARNWIVAFDYSMLTYLEVPKKELRADELTATLGYRHDFAELPESWVAAGIGVRHSGDLSGQNVQNEWHNIWDYDRVNVTYEESRTAGVGYVAGGWAWRPESEAVRQRFGIFVNGAALTTETGELNSALSVNAALAGRDAAFWLGLRQNYNTGENLSVTADKTAEHENGTWLMVGASAGAWFFEGGTSLKNGGTQGRLGFLWDRGTDSKPAQISDIEGVLGLYDGYALGLQYRWRPAWLDEFSNQRMSLMLDYRFGQYPGVDWRGNNILFRQPVVGLDASLFPVQEGLYITPFAYSAVGVREEKVELTYAKARFPSDSAVRGVVQAGVGLRCFWGKLPGGQRTTRYGISLVYDWWLPWNDAVVSNGQETGIYQEANAAAGIRLATTVAW